jgi:hypothetical protein
MSIEDTKAKIAVMQAYLDGKPIEYKSRHACDDPWELNDDPGWAFADVDYRVAPPRPRVRWHIFGRDGEHLGTAAEEIDASSAASRFGGTYAKFVEVL